MPFQPSKQQVFRARTNGVRIMACEEDDGCADGISARPVQSVDGAVGISGPLGDKHIVRIACAFSIEKHDGGDASLARPATFIEPFGVVESEMGRGNALAKNGSRLVQTGARLVSRNDAGVVQPNDRGLVSRNGLFDRSEAANFARSNLLPSGDKLLLGQLDTRGRAFRTSAAIMAYERTEASSTPELQRLRTTA